MINSRVHSMGDSSGENTILNKTLRKTYDRFLCEISLKSAPSVADKMMFVYFLQLQDRVKEACSLFSTIKRPSSGQDDGDKHQL